MYKATLNRERHYRLTEGWVGLSHACYDGFYFPLLLNDFRIACLGKLEQAQPPRYACFIQHHLQTSEHEETDRFWAVFLKGSQLTTLARRSRTLPLLMDQSVTKTIPFVDERPGGMSFATVAVRIGVSSIQGYRFQGRNLWALRFRTERFVRAFSGSRRIVSESHPRTGSDYARSTPF